MIFFLLLRTSLLSRLVFRHLPHDYIILKHCYPSLFLKLKREIIYLPNIPIFLFYVLKLAQWRSFEDEKEKSNWKASKMRESYFVEAWKIPLLWGLVSTSISCPEWVESISCLAGKSMWAIRAGGRKKHPMKPLLHCMIEMERCHVFLIVITTLGLQVRHEGMEGKLRALGFNLSSLFPTHATTHKLIRAFVSLGQNGKITKVRELNVCKSTCCPVQVQ